MRPVVLQRSLKQKSTCDICQQTIWTHTIYRCILWKLLDIHTCEHDTQCLFTACAFKTVCVLLFPCVGLFLCSAVFFWHVSFLLTFEVNIYTAKWDHHHSRHSKIAQLFFRPLSFPPNRVTWFELVASNSCCKKSTFCLLSLLWIVKLKTVRRLEYFVCKSCVNKILNWVVNNILLVDIFVILLYDINLCKRRNIFDY